MTNLAEQTRTTTSGSLPAAVLAVREIIAERVAQIDRHGHTPAADLAREPHALATLADQYGKIALDRAHRGPRQSLAGARKKAVQTAALWLAFIVRLDADITAQPATTEELTRG